MRTRKRGKKTELMVVEDAWVIGFDDFGVPHERPLSDQTNSLRIFCGPGSIPIDTSDITVYSYMTEDVQNPSSSQMLFPFLHQDGRIGMWDVNHNVFHPNMGTGEFVAGPVVDDDFWELEYIESTGEQYMDLEYLSDVGEDTIEIKFSLRDINHEGLVYATLGANNEVPCIGWHNQPESGTGLGVALLTAEGDVFNYPLGTDTDVKVVRREADIIYLDGEQVGDVISPEHYFTAANPSTLFGVPANRWGGKYRVYYADIDYARGAFARRLIPVKKKISGEVCMYDLVSKRFFYNKGTGEFIAGPIKNEGFKLTGTFVDGSTFDELLQTSYDTLYWLSARTDTLKTIKIDDSKVSEPNKLTTCGSMFYNCVHLTDVDLENVDMSKVSTIARMFSGCEALTALKASTWNTSNISHMWQAFQNCRALTTVDVSNWDMSNVTSAFSMFYGCYSLTTLDVSNWDTSSLNNAFQMFAGCDNLLTLDVSNWDMSNVTSMSSMFLTCESLTVIDTSKWEVSPNLTDMAEMFTQCYSLRTIDLSRITVGGSVDLYEAFNGCKAVTTAYGKDEASCALLNASEGKAANVNFIVKQSIFRTSDNEIFKTNDNKILRV